MSNKPNGRALSNNQPPIPSSVEYKQDSIGGGEESQEQVYTYESPWRTYALAYSWRCDNPLRYCMGSCLGDQINKVRGYQP